MTNYRTELKGLQTNLVQNPGFETSCGTNPCNWSPNINSGTPIFQYLNTARTGTYGAGISSTSSADAYWNQYITGLSPSTSYVLSGYLTTSNVTGTGAYIEVDWYDSLGAWLSTSTSLPKTGTSGWTQYSLSTTSPSSGVAANIDLRLVGIGYVIFDDISFVISAVCNNPVPNLTVA